MQPVGTAADMGLLRRGGTPPGSQQQLPPEFAGTRTAPAARPFRPKGVRSARDVIVGVGALMLTLLCVIPVWNAIVLMVDENFTFWIGRSLPAWLVFIAVSIVALYMFTVTLFFKYGRPETQTEQTVMSIAGTFVSLLGLALVLNAIPLVLTTDQAYMNLRQFCDTSEMTSSLWAHSQVLQQLRALPECKEKFSVAECDGFVYSEPQTSFLQHMEEQFRCRGFCYRAPLSDAQAAAPAAANGTASLVAAGGATQARSGPSLLLRMLGFLQSGGQGGGTHTRMAELQARSRADNDGALCLFSDAEYTATCEGMMSRDLKLFAGDVAYQNFMMGVYLLLVAIAVGFLKIIGFCNPADLLEQQGLVYKTSGYAATRP